MSSESHGSFEEFVEAQMPRLLALGRILTGNDHDAWDLTQDALARVGVRWAKVDQEGNPAAYARTALVRLNLNRLRRFRRELLMWSVPELPHTGDAPDPDTAAALSEALMSLPARQRTALALRYFEDLPIAAVASAMSCAEGTVKSQISRGLRVLRERAPELDNL